MRSAPTPSHLEQSQAKDDCASANAASARFAHPLFTRHARDPSFQGVLYPWRCQADRPATMLAQQSAPVPIAHNWVVRRQHVRLPTARSPSDSNGAVCAAEPASVAAAEAAAAPCQSRAPHGGAGAAVARRDATICGCAGVCALAAVGAAASAAGARFRTRKFFGTLSFCGRSVSTASSPICGCHSTEA